MKEKTVKNITEFGVMGKRGITLIALVVAIIIIIILLSISVSITIGLNGIISRAEMMVVLNRRATYTEEIELVKTDKGMEKIENKWTSKEYMDALEEKLIEASKEEDNRLKDITVTRENDLEIKVVSKEGDVFIITEGETEYIGNMITDPTVDLQEGDIQSKIDPSGPTNDKVTVTITMSEALKEKMGEKGKLEYAINNTDNWTEYKDPIVLEKKWSNICSSRK